MEANIEWKKHLGIYVLWIAMLFSPSIAYAYLDPGTGSLIVQGVIAAILGGLYWVKLMWGRIVQFFKRTFSKKEDSGDLDS